MKLHLALPIAAALLAGHPAAAEEPTPSTKTTRAEDKAIDKIDRAANKAGDAVKEGAQKTGDAIEKAGDTLKADMSAAATGTGLILRKLHHTNQMEIDMGNLAKEKGTDKKLREYGAMLVKDHTKADKKVMSLAKKKDMTLTGETVMTDEEKRDHDEAMAEMDRLKGLTGAEFDKAFAESMEKDHTKVITMLTDARKTLDDKDCDKLIGQLLPSLEKHRKTAADLAARLSKPAS